MINQKNIQNQSLQYHDKGLAEIDLKYTYGEIRNQVKVKFLSKSENVALARMIVSGVLTNAKQEAAEITLSQLEEIKVAVSEAVSNAIIHGYQNQENQWVDFVVTLYDFALVIEIIDEGIGISDIQKAMEPNFSTALERMGLGFAFMNSFMDTLKVDSQPDQGTRVTLIKHLPLAES